jgi:hypothetical protein
MEEIFRITAANFTSSCSATSAFFNSEKINFSLFSMPLHRSLKIIYLEVPAEQEAK